MTEIFKQRMTASVDDDFVVFLIGMRFNSVWKVHKWLPVFTAMPKMVDELYQHPELGFVHHESWFGRTTIMVQYWKSFELLEEYAKNQSANHLPAWKAFNQQVASNGDVGIWHETYLCPKGQFECVYNNMPRFGLANLDKHVPVGKRMNSASERVGQQLR